MRNHPETGSDQNPKEFARPIARARVCFPSTAKSRRANRLSPSLLQCSLIRQAVVWHTCCCQALHFFSNWQLSVPCHSIILLSLHSQRHSVSRKVGWGHLATGSHKARQGQISGTCSWEKSSHYSHCVWREWLWKTMCVAGPYFSCTLKSYLSPHRDRSHLLMFCCGNQHRMEGISWQSPTYVTRPKHVVKGLHYVCPYHALNIQEALDLQWASKHDVNAYGRYHASMLTSPWKTQAVAGKAKFELFIYCRYACYMNVCMLYV